MTVDPSQIYPLDDTGRDTFERYCYQAHIAFPYCLECALGGDIISVVAEHIEDIAVEHKTGWRFLQIKTRDLAKGPWRLSDLTAKGGGLHSLLRTYKLIKDLPNTRLELHLEGALQRRDLIEKLQGGEGPLEPLLVSSVRSALKMVDGECEDFLNRVSICHSRPARSTIQAYNLRLLVNQAGHLVASDLDDIYDRVIGLIYQAMQAKLLPAKWKVTLLSHGSLKGKSKALFFQKQITPQHLAPVVARLTSPRRPLLKRLREAEFPMSVLEQKLVIGGASPDLISCAKLLRANASQIEFEHAASEMYDEAVFEDLQHRLLYRAHGLVDQYGTGNTPAATIWNKLVIMLGQQAHLIDSRGVFCQDPDLLLGVICDLSDRCKINWGVADA